MIKAWMMKPPTAGGGGFSPSDIAGMVGWFSASDIVGKVDGDPISPWDDLTATNNDFVQTDNNARRPFYKTNIINGLPALLFDGSDDYLVRASTTHPQTIAVVAKYTLANFNEYDGLITTSADAWLRGNNGTANWYTTTGPTGRKYYKDGVETSSTVTNAWHVFILTHTTEANYSFCIGNDSWDMSRTWNGYIAEICIYNSVLSGDDFTNLNDYLMTKYGLV